MSREEEQRQMQGLSQVINILISILLFASFLAGCAERNPQAAFGVDGHPADWRSLHGSRYISNTASCEECHGADLRGGISRVSCYSSEFEGMSCHSVGPSGHPEGWADPLLHGARAEQDFGVCKFCHGLAYEGSGNAVSCYQCHNGPGLDHPAQGWVLSNHVSSADADITSCQNCHGADYRGGASHLPCAGCHMESESKVHLLRWYPDVQAAHRGYAEDNGTSNCANIYCHGASLDGASGPSCSTCHAWPLSD